jgi:hypothetical protein
MASFHSGQFTLTLRQMATSQAKKIIRANRLSTCAMPSCRRPFAVCVSCDRGRRYCSHDCARTARSQQLRRAGRRFQATPRGRIAHALRQARYRARQSGVTHRSVGCGSAWAQIRKVIAGNNGDARRFAEVHLRELSHGHSSASVPPNCVACGGGSGFFRNGFLGRPQLRSCPFGRRRCAMVAPGPRKNVRQPCRSPRTHPLCSSARSRSSSPNLQRAPTALFTGELHRNPALPRAR